MEVLLIASQIIEIVSSDKNGIDDKSTFSPIKNNLDQQVQAFFGIVQSFVVKYLAWNMKREVMLCRCYSDDTRNISRGEEHLQYIHTNLVFKKLANR